jgi:poly(3-hydroxybutyrate) depolymerase
MSLDGTLHYRGSAITRSRRQLVRKADSVRQLMTEIQRGYTGDPDRTYLTGFSFGGNGVLT